jgi:hypothetical protein
MKKTLSLKILVLLVFACFTQNPSSAQWIETSGPSGGVVEALSVSGEYLIAGTYGGGIFGISENDTIWTKLNAGLLNTNVNSLAVSDSCLFAGTFGGVFKSTNNGANWLPAGMLYTNIIEAFAISGTTILAGTRTGAYLSGNNAGNWNPINTGLADANITSVAISDNYLFAGTETGIYRAARNEQNWSLMNNGLKNTKIRSLLLNNEYLLAGTDSGIFLTSNNGVLWNQIYNILGKGSVHALVAIGKNLFASIGGFGIYYADANTGKWVSTDIPESMVFSLAVYGKNLYAGSGTSVWRRPISEMVTGLEDNDMHVSDFTLAQNFPNPFNANTIIEYSLSLPSHVSLFICNTQGQTIDLIDEGIKPSGRYMINFDSTDLPSGIYYCKLTAGNQTKGIKMVKNSF